jgi:hypothetical protein
MSDLRVNTISASDGTSPVTLTKQSAAKVLYAFDQIGGHYGLNTASSENLNVSSVVDHATGSTKPSFTNNMATNEYIVPTGAHHMPDPSGTYTNARWATAHTLSTSGLGLLTCYTYSNFQDNWHCCTAHGDLA